MKIKAITNGNIIDADDDAARELIDAGIYEPVDATQQPETGETVPTSKATPKATPKAAPLTTKGVPTPAKPLIAKPTRGPKVK